MPGTRELLADSAQSVKIGPFISSADGHTPLTGLSITQSDVRLSYNDGAFAQKIDTGSATSDEFGWYDCPLAAADTNAGHVKLSCKMAGALIVWHEFEIPASNNYYRKFSDYAQREGYTNGRIWIDTALGIIGTTPYLNGIAGNPSLLWSDAKTISTATGYTAYQLQSGSTITFTAIENNFEVYGEANTEVQFGGQTVTNAYFEGCQISGEATGTFANPLNLTNCLIHDAILPDGCVVYQCGITGDIELKSGTHLWADCRTVADDTSAPTLTFRSSTILNCRAYSGYLKISSMTAGSVAVFEGWGEIQIGADCTGGTIILRGFWEREDLSGGAVTIEYDATYLRSDGVLIDNTQNAYFSQIKLTLDPANTQDEWTVNWYENGNQISYTRIANPTLRLEKRSDGTTLWSYPLTQFAAGSNSYKLDIVIPSERIIPGEAVNMVAVADIDTLSRQSSAIVSRDGP